MEGSMNWEEAEALCMIWNQQLGRLIGFEEGHLIKYFNSIWACMIVLHVTFANILTFHGILTFLWEHPFLFIWSYINKQRRKVYLVKLPTISANKQNDVCCCKILWNILQGILQNGPNGPICISHYINRITNVDIFLFFLSETQLVVRVITTWFRILQIHFSFY